MTAGWRTGVAIALCLWSTALSAQEAVSHRLGGGAETGVSVGRIVLSLILCIIIAALAVLLIRQRSGKSDLTTLFSRIDTRTRAMDIVETRRMSPHADACVVRHRDREYLLVLQPGNVVVLRDEPVDAGDPPCA